MKKSLFGGIMDKTAALGPVMEKYGWKEGSRIGDHTGSKGGVRAGKKKREPSAEDVVL